MIDFIKSINSLNGRVPMRSILQWVGTMCVEYNHHHVVYAKKNGLAVTMYQDYGWPAKKLEE